MKRKNTILLALLLVAMASPAWSQVELGLQFSPSLSFNRINDDDAAIDLSSDGVGLRMVGGLMGDVYLQENYYFSTGLFFVSKRVGIEDAANNVDEAYRLHYLQVPATLKLFTNEVALDMRIYFQVGLTLDVNIMEDNITDEATYIQNFRNFDSNVLLASGLEYRIGYSTTVYGGLSYRRGLVNVVKDPGPDVGDVIIKNDLLSLDLGVKF